MQATHSFDRRIKSSFPPFSRQELHTAYFILLLCTSTFPPPILSYSMISQPITIKFAFLRCQTLLIIIVLSTLWPAAASVRPGCLPSSRILCNTNLNCRGGSSTASLLSTSTLISRRKHASKKSRRNSSAETIVNSKYRKPDVILASTKATRVYDEPSLDELRAQLGPIALLVSNTIELTVVTLGSYISGGLLGYFGGGVLNLPSTIFDKTSKGIMTKFAALHSKAWMTCKQWGMLSAAFSGFNNAVRMVRGDREDGWNAVWGSALTGAFLSRAGEF